MHCGYLEGQGDLVSKVIKGIVRETMWVLGVINILTGSPLPSKHSKSTCREPVLLPEVVAALMKAAGRRQKASQRYASSLSKMPVK